MYKSTQDATFKNKKVYLQRREELKSKIQTQYPDQPGALVFFSSFEAHKYKFKQNSLFYYFTGLAEPAVVFLSDFKTDKLFIPSYKESPGKWVSSCVYGSSSAQLQEEYGIDKTELLGDSYHNYTFSMLAEEHYYRNLVEYIKDLIASDKKIFVAAEHANFFDQKIMLNKLLAIIPELKSHILDVSDIVASMRRNKSKEEIAYIYNAINCTIEAQEIALSLIKTGQKEYNIQAGIDFVFANYGATQAFPSIVASGRNSVILHSCQNTGKLEKGDLVVIDIGAELDYYCADLTRTYPVSGTYSQRQKDIYTLVLDTQHYIADHAQPGYWIKNNNEPERSLHHLAQKYLEKYGYSSYFTHGIGHYLGLDVHDVGSYQEPLQEGDVITIEPGIYIKEENLGVRLEDNYWIVKGGAICLSEDLPKDTLSIEKAMADKEA